MDPRFITDLRRSLDEHGVITKIVADDLVNTWGIVEAMKRDAALRDAVAVMGTHYPQPRLVTPERAKRASRDWGKPIWSTEDGPWADKLGSGRSADAKLCWKLCRGHQPQLRAGPSHPH